MRKLSLILSMILLILLPSSACAVSTETITLPVVSTTVTETAIFIETETIAPVTVTETATASIDTFYAAVDSVKNNSLSVTIYHYGVSQIKKTIAVGDPAFSQVVEYVSNSFLVKTVKRYQGTTVTAGPTKTIEVTWLYGRGIMMDFTLSGGSSLLLECSGAGVYYQTPQAMFGGSPVQGLYELLAGIIGPRNT